MCDKEGPDFKSCAMPECLNAMCNDEECKGAFSGHVCAKCARGCYFAKLYFRLFRVCACRKCVPAMLARNSALPSLCEV